MIYVWDIGEILVFVYFSLMNEHCVIYMVG